MYSVINFQRVQKNHFFYFSSILIFCDNVTMEFSGQDAPAFKGTKQGRVYLTTHRMIFNNKKASDPMQSFSFPFVTLNDVSINLFYAAF